MKRLRLCLITVFLLLTVFCLAGCLVSPDAEGTIGYDHSWRFYSRSGTLELSGNGDIPTLSVSEYPWNEYLPQISRVVFRPGITGIPKQAFFGYETLRSVSFPKGLKEIGEYAFEGCTSLEKVTIPGSVERIDRAFGECTALKKVTLNDGLVYMDGAFSGCTSLKTAEVPASVICANYAFRNCTALEKARVRGSDYMVGIFAGCSSLKSVVLSHSISWIDREAFRDCVSLRAIRLPKSVTSIDYGAFAGCTALERVKLPKKLTQIGNGSFSGCTALTEIRLPDSLYTLEDSAFAASGLREIEVPGTVFKIPFHCFSGCKELRLVTLNAGICQLDTRCFVGCDSLETISFPDTLTFVQADAFEQCASLTEIELPSGLKELPESVFLTDLGYALVFNPIEFRGTFIGCESLQRAVIRCDPHVVTEATFTDCENLKYFMFPDPAVDMAGIWLESCSDEEKSRYVICGIPGSTAEAFAQANGFAFSAES